MKSPTFIHKTALNRAKECGNFEIYKLLFDHQNLDINEKE